MMRGKLALIVGVAIGYVLGARAGRQRYEQIKRAASRLWHNPRVQHQVHEAEEFVRDKAPDVVDFLSDGAKKVVSRASGKRKSAAATGTTKARKANPVD